MSWFLAALKKYAVFSGRARRKEYWMYILFYIIIDIVLLIIDNMVFVSSEGGMPILSSIFALGMLLPSLGVSIRRLHDTNHSGWWILISFVPLVGVFILLYFMIKEGDAGDNQYGPNPIVAGT